MSTAVAHPNIALVKYWGKRDTALNLPAAGSLSLTLAGDGLETRTEVEFDAALAQDTLELDGQPADERATGRTTKFLDLVRAEAGIEHRARVVSHNDFPTSAGLASSSSGFAALAVAACKAAGLEADAKTLSVLSRRGSGSAARSVHGGFVEMLRGEAEDGLDAYAIPVAPAEHWDLRVLFCITRTGPKDVPSTDGMLQTAETSPYYRAWVDTVAGDIEAARSAILARDIEALGEVAEFSALKMHACAMGARPAVLYFQGKTLDLIHAVRALRRDGLPAWVTIDAGPHVKVLCEGDAAPQVADALRDRPEVMELRSAHPGPGAYIVEA